MTVTINGTTGITSPEVVLDNAAADGGQVVLKSSGYSNWNWDNYSGRLRAYYNATEYFTITNSGNVGIGTSSPTSFGAGYTTLALSGSNAGIFQSKNTLGDTRLYANTSGEALVGSWANTALKFYTNSTLQATLDSSGSLLVGTTDSGIGSGPGVKIAQNIGASVVSTLSTNSYSTSHVYSTTAGAYRFYVGWGGTVYATSTTISAISDIRYKENIRDLNVGLAEVMALKPRLYDWKEGKGANIKNARGFIAQEFEQVFPDLIDEWKDPAPEGEEPYKSVRQDLIPVLVKAIQELNAKIDSLQETVTAQAAKIEALEAKNA